METDWMVNDMGMKAIPDGYTWSWSNGFTKMQYRPMLDAERRELFAALRFYNVPKLAHSVFESHIVSSDPIIEDPEGLFIHEYDVWDELFQVICGLDGQPPWTPRWELETEQNLFVGTQLQATHPRVANRDCDHCQIWWYDERTGKVLEGDDGPRTRAEGGDGARPWCETTIGCAKGTPQRQRTFSEVNRMAYNFDRDCRATGCWPDDPIVRRHARIIAEAMGA